MSETTVQQSATSTREQIWLNREQVRKEKTVYRALKRAQDIFFSLLALIVLSPLLLIVAIAIVIDDPKGSPVFTQVRSGLDGKEFRIHKFRSMCVDAEAKLADLKRRTEMNGPIFKQKDDPRITRVGRFIRKCGIDLNTWLEGFKDTPESVRKTVETIKTHPLIPCGITVRGFIIDSETGCLEEIECR